MKVNKKDSRLWHIAKKYAPKKLGAMTMLKPIRLSDDGLQVTLVDEWTTNKQEMTFTMKQLVKYLGVPNGGKFEFQNLSHKGE